MEQGGVYWNAWKELFYFHKNHVGIEQTDGFWELARDDAVALEKKYKGTKAEDFVCGVLVQILLELERVET